MWPFKRSPDKSKEPSSEDLLEEAMSGGREIEDEEALLEAEAEVKREADEEGDHRYKPY